MYPRHMHYLTNSFSWMRPANDFGTGNENSAPSFTTLSKEYGETSLPGPSNRSAPVATSSEPTSNPLDAEYPTLPPLPRKDNNCSAMDCPSLAPQSCNLNHHSGPPVTPSRTRSPERRRQSRNSTLPPLAASPANIGRRRRGILSAWLTETVPRPSRSQHMRNIFRSQDEDRLVIDAGPLESTTEPSDHSRERKRRQTELTRKASPESVESDEVFQQPVMLQREDIAGKPLQPSSPPGPPLVDSVRPAYSTPHISTHAHPGCISERAGTVGLGAHRGGPTNDRDTCSSDEIRAKADDILRPSSQGPMPRLGQVHADISQPPAPLVIRQSRSDLQPSNVANVPSLGSAQSTPLRASARLFQPKASESALERDQASSGTESWTDDELFLPRSSRKRIRQERVLQKQCRAAKDNAEAERPQAGPSDEVKSEAALTKARICETIKLQVEQRQRGASSQHEAAERVVETKPKIRATEGYNELMHLGHVLHHRRSGKKWNRTGKGGKGGKTDHHEEGVPEAARTRIKIRETTKLAAQQCQNAPRSAGAKNEQGAPSVKTETKIGGGRAMAARPMTEGPLSQAFQDHLQTLRTPRGSRLQGIIGPVIMSRPPIKLARTPR